MPEDLLLARVGRHLASGSHVSAVQELGDFLAIRPESSCAHQLMGHALAATGDAIGAIAAYDRATRLNFALLESWKALALLHRGRGDAVLATRAEARVQQLAQLPAPVLTATIELNDHKLHAAEKRCREFLRSNPRNVDGMRLLASIGMQLGIVDDAEFLLENCLFFDPTNIMARFDYVRVLHKRQKFSAALVHTKILLGADPSNGAFRSAFAAASLALGDFASALETYEKLAAENSSDHQTFLFQGHALKTVGRTEEAIAAYRRAFGLKPDFGDAFWSLANLKTYEFTEDEIGQMQVHSAAPETSITDRYHLCFALGKAYEHRHDYATSFAHFKRGNELKKSQLHYRPERVLAEMARQKEVFSADFLAARRGSGHPAGDPIFIVGLPRAGSTLLEQVLASHPAVDGTLELPEILSTVYRLNGRQMLNTEPRYPAVLRELRPETFRKLGEEYLAKTRVYRKTAPFFTDKMPNNFRHIGLIHLMLPNARIIDARRHPMACGLSNFQQLFAEGQEFSYSLADLGDYYRAYVDLMDHWNRVLPGRILRVFHEDMVADLEGQVRRILDFCGLPFDERCLNFHETERAVRTASSEQVRQPLNRSGVERWKNYEPFLAPLADAIRELDWRGG